MIDRFRSKKYATLKQVKDRIETDRAPKKMLVIINAYSWENWPNAMQLYYYICNRLKEKVDLVKLADNQDNEGKWTLTLIIEFRGNRESLKKAISDRAKTIAQNPETDQLSGGLGPSVEFKDIK